MKLTFLGATQTVTGSKYLITTGSKNILIDCGLFQGQKELRLRNWEKPPIDPGKIDYVILTHAHIDHSGYIPLLVKNGFKGKIYCSSATLELCKVLLPDSGYLHEEDARRANRYGYTKHNPAMPLYTQDDANASLKYFHPVDFGKPISLDEVVSFTLSRSGHILGSSFVVISDGMNKITFSGDLGRMNDPIMDSPAKLDSTDYLVIESTYGDRLHEKVDPEKYIGKLINQTIKKGGSILIPAFAVGRAQTMLYFLYKLRQDEKIPYLPIFLDSPMAIDATNIFRKFKNEHRLSEQMCQEVCSIATYVKTADESKQLDNMAMPSVIISASGMATGGRVLHHLKKFLPNPKNTILFTGFQARETRGDRITRGEKTIKIHGDYYPVKAKIQMLHNISAHADYEEILHWIGNFKTSIKKVFITHGEAEAAEALKEKIETQFGFNVVVAKYLQEEEI